MKIALLYDRVNKWGGAERVLMALHEVFPEAPLFTAVYSSRKAKWAEIFPEVIPTFLQKIPFTEDKHELLGTFTPIAFETLDLSDFDLVISVTSEAAKGVIVAPPAVHLCYCLTPTRYLWSAHDLYFKNPLLWLASRPAVNYLRHWDKIAGQRPDRMIAISKAVKRRIKKYYDRNSDVIFPPVELEKFKINPMGNKRKDFFLIVSRLVSYYKRVDLVISAFNDLGLPLYVVGAGRNERKLKAMSKRNIKFLGHLTDAKLADYYKKCAALVFPQEEDFGIVALEAQAAGAPVIAYRKGGALDTIIEGKTGVFFDKQTKKSLMNAVKKFQKLNFNQRESVKNAERFSKERFKKEFKTLVKKWTT
jgi:glycosyltransferase involved in cell wall biosynthesis